MITCISEIFVMRKLTAFVKVIFYAIKNRECQTNRELVSLAFCKACRIHSSAWLKKTIELLTARNEVIIILGV